LFFLALVGQQYYAWPTAQGYRSGFTITDSDPVSSTVNPIDTTQFFFRQHYVDFLNREPEPQGFADWQAILNNCPAGNTQCDRVQVSSDFYRSPEFGDRGYFVYRFFEAALGRKPGDAHCTLACLWPSLRYTLPYTLFKIAADRLKRLYL